MAKKTRGASPSRARQTPSTNGPKRSGRETAETMAARQREISVSEFFAKNRHLLGFDNPRKALLTTVKEAVDNALDACEEAGILPELRVELHALERDDRFLVAVQDNGPGIVRRQIENIFGKLLYGSKFHRLKMSRGQQGIGISAAGMYGLMTTGKPVKIITKTKPGKPAHEVILKMDTSKNRADVVSETEHPEDDAYFLKERNGTGTGTRVEIELEGKYLKGDRSVDQYVRLTAIANPHARIVYAPPATASEPRPPDITLERSVHELPAACEEIKPHPHGIELGTLIGMLERTEHTQLGGFFANEFCRIGPKLAQQVSASAALTTRSWVKGVTHEQAERLYEGLRAAKVMGPPTNCLSPIGVKTMLKGLEAGLAPDFITASSRTPAVYRGRPFVIEVGVAFGGNLPAEEQARVYRFANRVPLQYQQSACASFKSVLDTAWRQYGLQQPRGSLPVGPMVVMIHMASVWVPFTSESKEAIADYDEIRAEMQLALKDCARKLRAFLNRRKAMKRQGERRDAFVRYIGEISRAAHEITGADRHRIYDALMSTAQRKTAEFDQELDEEGRVVEPASRIDRDHSVYIRAETPTPTGADIDLDHAENGHTGGTLFGDDGDPDRPPAPTRRTRKVKKKVVKKRSSRAPR